MGLTIWYFKGLQEAFSKLLCIFVPEDCFTFNLSKSEDRFAYLGLHCLPKVPV